VAVEVAHTLRAPLDVFLVRKLAVPNQPEVAMGILASGGVEVWDDAVIREQRVSAAMIETVAEHERGELRRRERTYRGMKPMPPVTGATVILIDDGLTTGNTMRSAIAALRQSHPHRIVAATPVGSRQTCELLRGEADEVVCALSPEPLYSVSRWYRDYSPIMDRDIRDMLERVEFRALAGAIH
jgi:predicted phosphoribosyltransferase